jgi:hypothetical protein
MSDQSFVYVFFSFIALVVIWVTYVMWREDRRAQNVIDQARERLKGRKVVVAIRMKDGKRNYWETLFVKQLMDLGATVLDFSPENANRLWGGDRNYLPEDALGFVGTTWQEGGITWYLDGKFLPKRSGNPITTSEPILAPFFSRHDDVADLHYNLAECVRHYL